MKVLRRLRELTGVEEASASAISSTANYASTCNAKHDGWSFLVPCLIGFIGRRARAVGSACFNSWP
jgi:hypothetical protein